MEKIIHKHEERHLFQPREKGRVLRRFPGRDVLKSPVENKGIKFYQLSFDVLKLPRKLLEEFYSRLWVCWGGSAYVFSILRLEPAASQGIFFSW